MIDERTAPTVETRVWGARRGIRVNIRPVLTHRGRGGGGFVFSRDPAGANARTGQRSTVKKSA